MLACVHPTENALLAHAKSPTPEVTAHVQACDRCASVLDALVELSLSCDSYQDRDEPLDAHGALPLPGDSVGRYQVNELLAQGAMGAVYRAFDPQLNRSVAIKLLRQVSPLEDAKLICEARAAAQVAHPHIVTIYDVGPWRGRIYLAMELIDGVTLQHWRRSGPGAHACLEVTRDIADALATAHRRGVMHCDVKPDNIVIADGQAKLADFGLALGSNEAPGGTRGTPAYMAPELRAGAAPSALSDQYAFAKTMLSLPLAPRIARVLRRGLAPEPAQRFPSMTALILALDRSARRPKRAALAASGVLSLGAIGGALLLTRQPMASCADGAASLATSWHPAIMARIARALPDPQAQTRVVEALHSYAQDLAQAATTTCSDTRVRQTHSEAAHDLRAGCLAQARGRFETLVRVLAVQPKLALEPALAATEALPEVHACHDMARLLRQTRGQGIARATLDQQRLDEAFTLYSLGNFNDALALLDLLQVAAQPASTAMLAPSAYLRGQIHSSRGQWPAARTALEAAYRAVLTNADDSLEVEIVLELAHVLMQNTDTEREGNEWLARAEAILHRTNDARHWAALHELRGQAAWQKGQYATAVPEFRAAIRYQIERGPQGAFRIAFMQSSLGSALANSGAYDQAREQFTAALTSLYQRRGPDNPWMANVYNSLGVMESSLGRTDAARTALQHALRIRQRSLGDDNNKTAIAKINLAAALLQQHSDADARKYYQEALFTFEKQHNASAARKAKQGLAQLALRAGNVQDALAQQRALLKESLDDTVARPLDIASVRVALADALTSARRDSEASKEFAAAREVFVTAHGEAHVRVAYIDARLAEVELRAGNGTAATQRAHAALQHAVLPAADRAKAHWVLAQATLSTDRTAAFTHAAQAQAAALADHDANLASQIATWLRQRQTLSD